MKHMSKLIPADAPLWMKEANGNAVFCKVSNGGIFDDYAWIVPVYNHMRKMGLKFLDIDWNTWEFAEPVTGEETLRETEHLR